MKVLSNWRSVRLWETQVERDLHREHDLRLHGLLIGTSTLLLMWLSSWLQMKAGVESLALRYLLTLGVGYLGYLWILRWWATMLIRKNTQFNPDLPDPQIGDWPSVRGGTSPTGAGHGVGDLAGGALEAAAGADEGAIVVVPVLAIFLIGVALFFGAGALVLLYFSSEALLAVAIELAFGYVTATAAMRVAREGWLTAAVRLTWKPLLGALLCAVLLGAALDRFMPQVNSLPEAVRVLLGRHRA
ncbi:hypothetical protein [Variovorax sp. RA8]|uniref:hypothetical protein n=1 Tax=Variovorax sp. (strain JCM 16519 / RA8) TaxID=662548 RepID=UPI001316318B|nr:hypothetical protein [Variovorax sp. RA8]VTU14008.1 hypothetical protein RA8CHR_00374 [Variovorax sp. RA8]